MTEFALTTAQDRARDSLISDAVHCCLGGGSRSGKTFLIFRMIVIRAIKAPGSRHVVFRFRFNAVKNSIVMDTLPKVLKLCFPSLPSADSMMNKTDWYLTLPNGSEIWFAGLDDKDRVEKILGMEFASIFFNESSQIPWASRVLAVSRLAQKTKLKLKAYYDLNPSSKSSWVYKMFIEKKAPDNNQPVLNPGNYTYFQINPIDNLDNLAPGYLAELEALPEKARKRFLLGQFSDDSDGALWTEELLAQNRVLGQEGTLPDWLRIIVAVDPSGCSGAEDKRSDEVGIVVVALGTDNKGYLLEDLSGRYKPEQWGSIAVEAYRRHKADKVIGETNYGGDMVRLVIHAVDDNVPFGKVTASRGKVPRAEPIAALYEQKKICHIGYFPELEDQLQSFTVSGYVGMKSPDRADAMVWGFTELFPQMTKRTEQYERPPQVHVAARSASRFAGKQRRRY